MTKQMKLVGMLSAGSVIAIASFLSGCAGNDPTDTAAPPPGPHANPAGILPAGEKHYMGQTGISGASTSEVQAVGRGH